MKKVFITGATSFIGVNLIKYLLETKYDIVAIVKENSKNISKLPTADNLTVIECNMNKIKNLDSIMNAKGDIFIHLAWNGTRGKDRDNKDMQEENYKNSIDAIEVAHNIGCKIFVGAGSQAEYGPCNSEIIESDKCYPITEYGKAKLRVATDGYQICKEYDMSFKWPRFFSLYGKDDYEETLIISTIDKLLLNKSVELTECIQMWNFLYIDDAIKGLAELIETDCIDGIYNFGSDDTRQLKLFVKQIFENIPTESKVAFGKIPYPVTGMVSVQPNIGKLKKETGWKPTTLFEKGIKEIIKERKKILGVK